MATSVTHSEAGNQEADPMLANVAEQASAIVYLVLSMVAGFLLVESGLWLGGRLMRSHMEAAGAREEL
jgi:hypothetical protein